MGKRDVRVVRVRKWMTALLLAVTTAAIVALLWALSGRAYATPAHSAATVARTIAHAAELPRDAVIAALMPVAANVILFVPWGFFAFVLLDRPSRSRAVTYALTFVAGVVFAAAIELWQVLLPTRVTTFSDALSNAVGTLLGSVAGHLRKQVRIRFEI